VKLLQTIIPDCFELTFDNRVDSRGNFVKTSHASVLAGLGLECNFRESFYTRSAHNVLRGMHLQLAPADGAKLVYCLQGAILDLALDLRPDSAAFGEVSTFELSEATTTAAYIPCGVAHGFYVLEGPALMMYHVTSEFNPQLDAGVRWDSFGFDWPCTNPHLSARDIALPTFAEFTSRQPPKSICHR
jgi:dTDP-4-dehydrorhamnose 3,5-epimerase